MLTTLLPLVLLYALFMYLFFRELRLDLERFREAHRLADAHFLKEVERFLADKRRKMP